jgi:methionyl-tRNA formyltransferase
MNPIGGPMNVVVLTAKDHLYANYLLRRLAREGGLREDRVLVVEQETVLSGQSRWASLRRYIETAGVRYTAALALKQYLFVLWRSVVALTGNRRSICYPYHREAPAGWRRRTLNGLRKPSTRRALTSFEPDLILSLLSRERIPRSVFELPRVACVNLHPSYLPEYRGVSPTLWCLAEGRSSGGVTLHHVDARFDSGAIISRREVSAEGHRSEHSFYLACVREGFDLVAEFVAAVRAGRDLPGEPAPSGTGCYRSLPRKEAIRSFRSRGYALFRLRDVLRGRFP